MLLEWDAMVWNRRMGASITARIAEAFCVIWGKIAG